MYFDGDRPNGCPRRGTLSSSTGTHWNHLRLAIAALLAAATGAAAWSFRADFQPNPVSDLAPPRQPTAVALRQASTPRPNEPDRQQPARPRFIAEYGVRLEDEPHVRALLSASAPCQFWTGAYSSERASVFDLIRLRRLGYASLPTDYEIHHEAHDGADYVVIREHVKSRNGSDLPGMPGYVEHRYLYDTARERFEHLTSTAEDPNFDRRLLQALGDPVEFLNLHTDAVCNGRRVLPENRAADPARASAPPPRARYDPSPSAAAVSPATPDAPPPVVSVRSAPGLPAPPTDAD